MKNNCSSVLGSKCNPFIFKEFDTFYIKDRGHAICIKFADNNLPNFTDKMAKDHFFGKYVIHYEHLYKIIGIETYCIPDRPMDRTAFLLKFIK